ncbi:hypothetical protein Kpol_209p1 [Vanderwaltozyma polyspora DSM 70294]|uniref:non-specific serine/threonine protein kinase n=1 Tax=Vanderwaltozyma polyspora (strain ATCC 22028 / DSM 70294 / BCRC 21397 / CBS 2163 / NBRC 10782 / NRRL Y-8283 / UCD 57-17) TaxID=436907 RepID=A7TTK3_VANPO|nr:uncharacterized protein Kpol_209p1 [Vanderwaltozyma polyspora DSM 70294]EDO14403.1 hypothetical protein Kpol_209p1 [Vanderwaltozyma polyspora DSM 70294]
MMLLYNNTTISRNIHIPWLWLFIFISTLISYTFAYYDNDITSTTQIGRIRNTRAKRSKNINSRYKKRKIVNSNVNSVTSTTVIPRVSKTSRKKLYSSPTSSSSSISTFKSTFSSNSGDNDNNYKNKSNSNGNSHHQMNGYFTIPAKNEFFSTTSKKASNSIFSSTTYDFNKYPIKKIGPSSSIYRRKANMMIPYNNDASLDNFSIQDIVLVSDLKGGLHAVNRYTGENLWSLNHIDENYSTLSIQDPNYNVTTSVNHNKNNETLIIEPFGDGNIYFFNIFQGLTKLPISIHQLIMSSPMNLKTNFIIDDIGTIIEEEKTYTGSRQTSMFTIDLITGTVISAFGFGTENKIYVKEDVIQENLIKIGRTTYELEIHSSDSPSYNVTYTTWQQNSLDLHLSNNYDNPKDGICICPVKTEKNNFYSIMAMDTGLNDVKWVSDEISPSIINNIFDVFKNNDTNENILIQHPFQKFKDNKKEENVDKVYIDLLENNSWIALSDKHFPSFVDSAKYSRYTQREMKLGDGFDYDMKLRILRNQRIFKSAIRGVHFLNNKKKNHYYNYHLASDNNLLMLPYDDEHYLHVEDGDVYINKDFDEDTTIHRNRIKTKRNLVDYEAVERRTSNEFDENDDDLRNYFSPEEFQAYKRRVHQQIAKQFFEESRNSESLFHFAKNFIYKVIETGFLLIALIFVMVLLQKFEILPPLNSFFRSSGLLPVREVHSNIDNDELLHEPNHIDNNFIEKNPTNEASDEINMEISKTSTSASTRSSNFTDSSSSKTLLNTDDTDTINLGNSDKRRKRKNKKGKKKQTIVKITDDEMSETKVHVNQMNGQLTAVSTEDYNGDDSLRSLSVSEKVLGYGSSGTVVYQGEFQGRPVAVKRMLIDFCDIATREIDLLTESDDHPNVIRYYCSEYTEKFLYIALELCNSTLEDLIDTRIKFPDLELSSMNEPPSGPLISDLNSIAILQQIAAGVAHLHLLKIIHRDLKPQNILVSTSKKLVEGHTQNQFYINTNNVRILISDFGLCKKLDADKSSFQTNTNNAAGTTGWRAPELLDSNRRKLQPIQEDSEHDKSSNINSSMESFYDPFTKLRLTRAIDIFSLGCVFYYVLSNGQHPFGDRYMREANIIKGNYSLHDLDSTVGNPALVIEAKDLIEKMLDNDPLKRPSASNVLKHPLFWSASKKLQFLLKISDRFEFERRDPPSPLLLTLESHASKVIENGDWTSKFNSLFIDNLGRYRKYHGEMLMDLLRSLRNKYHHYNDMPQKLMNEIGQLPDGFYNYFLKKFPNLLIEIYIMASENLSDDRSFKEYL